MRDPERIEPFLQQLKELWLQVPDWRFGQLVENVVIDISMLWGMEDSDFLTLLERFKRTEET
jgi:hypothetical protein